MRGLFASSGFQRSGGGQAARFLTGGEAHLKDAATGRYCHGDAITLADMCPWPRSAGARNPREFRVYHPVRSSGGELGRLDLQDFARAHDRDRPRLHRLWDLAHQVDVQEPVLQARTLDLPPGWVSGSA